MASYTRQSTFSDGDLITAELFNDEYNQLLAAFENTTGHKHDGTVGEGPVISIIGDAGLATPLNKILIDTTNDHIEFWVDVSGTSTQQLYITDGAILPVTDNDIDLGSNSLQFKDLYINGTANIDTVDIDAGTIDGVTIGGSSAGAITGTTITGTSFVIGSASINETELEILDGATLTTTELNYVDGVTSSIQTQIDTKAPLASPSLTGIPTAPTAASNTNTTQIATTAYVQTEITDLIGAAPGTLDTLNELAAAINDDANYNTTLTTALATKLPLAGGTMTGNVTYSDNVKAQFGTSQDLQLYHDGSHSYIQDSGSGNLRILVGDLQVRNYGTNENIITSTANAEVSLYYNASEKLATTNTGIDVTGVITTDGLTTSANINFGDNDKAVFGAGSDLQLYHDGSNSYIKDAGIGNLQIQATGSTFIKSSDGTKISAQFAPDSYTRLYYNNAIKLQTTSTGIDVTGTVTSDSALLSSTSGGILTLEDSDATSTFNRSEFSNSAGTLNINTRQSNGTFVSTDYQILKNASGSTLHRLLTQNKKRLDIGSGGDISFYEDTGTTAKLFWDASAESLGIGTSSPSRTLHIKASVAGIRLEDSDGTSYGEIIYNEGSNGLLIRSDENNADSGSNIIFEVDGGEKARIDSSGNLLVSTTNTAPATNNVAGISLRNEGHINVSRASGVVGYFNRITNDGEIIRFNKDGTTVGSIGAYNSATAILSGSAGSYSGLYLNTNRIEPVGNNFGSEIRANDTIDIGSSTYKFKDLHLSGTANFGSLSDGTITITGFVDEDNMATNSATLVPTQQSVKAYVDSQISSAGGNGISFEDNEKAQFGDGNDLQIYHDGSHSRLVDSGTGNFIIQAAQFRVNTSNDAEAMIKADVDGAVTLYHNGSSKLATTSSGINVTGTVTSDALTVQTAQGDISIDNSSSTLNFARAGASYIRATNSLGHFNFITGANNFTNKRLQIASNGDISFYDDTGTTQGLFWDASAESLGIGTTSPSSPLSIGGTGSLGAISNNYQIATSIDGGFSTTNARQHKVIGFIGTTAGITDIYDSSYASGERSKNFYSGLFAENSYFNSSSYRIVQGGKSRLTIKQDGEFVINEDGIDRDFRVESDNNTHALFVQGSDGDVGIGTSSPSTKAHIVGSSVSGTSYDSNDMLTLENNGFSALNIVASPTTASTLVFSDDTRAVGYIQYNHGGNYMRFNSNGSEAMRIDSSQRVGIGTSSPSEKLTVAGIVKSNGFSTNTAGVSNFIAGVNAGSSIISGGEYNTLIGDEAGASITTGDFNVAVGTFALDANTTSSENTAIGYASLSNNITGARNVASGFRALQLNTASNDNTATGYFALYSTTGSNNTAIGKDAGKNITTGSKNTIIGSFDGNEGGLDIRTANNYIVLSDGDGNPRQVIDSSGNVGIGITNTSDYWGQADNLVVGGTGNNGITVKSSTSGNGRLVFTDTASSTAGLNDGGMIYYDHTSEAMGFQTDGDLAMTIDSSQNIGIGTTSPSRKVAIFDSVDGYNLELSQTGAYNSGLQSGIVFTGKYNTGNNVTNLASIRGGKENTTNWDFGGNLRFYTRTNGGVDTERLRINSSGNVGIGTSSPSSTLHIKGGSTTTQSTFSNFISNSTFRSVVNHANEYGLYMGYANATTDTSAIQSGRLNGTVDDLALNPYGGNVGIGTTSPDEALHVYHATGNINAIIESGDATAYLAFKDNSTSSNASVFLGASANDMIFFAGGTSERMRIDSSGNVGIGTSSPSSLLHLSSSSGHAITSTYTGQETFKFEHGTSGFYVKQDNVFQVGLDHNHDTIFYDDSGTEYVRLDGSTSRVGIGTSSPSLRLHSKDTGNYQLDLDSGGTRWRMGAGWSGFHQNSFLLADTANGIRMVVDTNGKVGIGTSSPDGKLHIKGGTATGDASHVLFENTQGSKVFAIGGGASGVTNNNLYIRNVTDNTTPMVITDAGKVGIGTSSPSATLDVAGRFTVASNDGHSDTKISSTVNRDPRLYFLEGTTQRAYIQSTAGTSQLILGTGSTERARIDSAGRVGIGTTSPTETLHVMSGVSNDTVAIISGSQSDRGLTISTYASDGRTDGGVDLDAYKSFKFTTDGTERARIDSSGNLLINKTSVNYNVVGIDLTPLGEVQATGDNRNVLTLNRKTTDGTLATFKKDGSTGGVIGVQEPQDNAHELYIANGTGTSNTGLAFWDYISPIRRIAPCDGAGNYVDNSIDLGWSSARFDDIYATNGTIQTSDRNDKQDIQALTAAETRVATACKGLLRRFRWQDAVTEKGDEARYHFGIISQDLQDAFTAEGLDAGDYGMFISETWEDSNGVEQTRLGVRYSELLAFIIAAI